jgi:hypothetical protein
MSELETHKTIKGVQDSTKCLDRLTVAAILALSIIKQRAATT